MSVLEREVRVKFKSNNVIPENVERIKIGEYLLEKIPSPDNSEAIVTYKVSSQGLVGEVLSGQAVLEGKYFLDFLSFASLSNSEFQSALVDWKNPPVMKYTLQRKPFDFAEVDVLYQKLCSLTEHDKRRFVNACKRYRQAVSIYDREPIVSLFLFVVAIECLSNAMTIRREIVEWSVYERFYGVGFNRKITKSVKFVEFICKYLPSVLLNSEGDNTLLKSRLLSAYFIRNAFVHDGEDLPSPVGLADRLKKRSVVYSVVKNRKEFEIRAPSLIWLERMVVNSLRGYLDRESGRSEPTNVFRDEAEQSGRYTMKCRKGHPSILKGQEIDENLAQDLFEMDD